MEDYDYRGAIDYFYRSKYLTPKGMRGMAISYSRLNQMDSAEKYYLQVINTGFHEIIDLYEYAEVLKVNGKYDEAFHWLAVYSEKTSPRFEGVAAVCRSRVLQPNYSGYS